MLLRPVSGMPTELNGKPVAQNTEIPLQAGDVVRVSEVLNIRFLNDKSPDSSGGVTVFRST